ncbi:MAG: glycosyltransferase family 4 protein [Planctomycetota bacterium]|jgi:glycosyltransferase involved in cell wall biosynthesis
MQITFILDHAGLSGGIRVVATYARMLQQRGHEVRIISRQYRGGGRRDRARIWLRRVTRKLTGQEEPSHLNELDVERWLLPAAVVPDDDIVPDGDVVIATWWETAEWVAALSPSKGAKAFFVQGYEIHEGQPIDRVKATWRLPLRKIAVSQWLADLARDRYHDADVLLVPNAVDHEVFHAPPRGKQDRPTVGFMYSAMPCKGCDICLDAIDIAREHAPELDVVAFSANQTVPELPLPDGCTFTVAPPQDRIRSIYAGCDAWLFGSRSEGFGLPLLEAMACRTPVIATPAGAAPELLGEGGGVIVRPEDPTDMARAILRVIGLGDPAWRRLSDEAHRVASTHTWELAADRFEAALRAVVSSAESRSTAEDELTRSSA